MNLDSEHNVFDIGDRTALVCIGPSSAQRVVSKQLLELEYKVHLGLFEEDILLKLTTYSYDVVVIDEDFGRSLPSENPILREMTRRSGAARRGYFVVLLSRRCATNDAMSAFVLSVDQIVNFEDLANFKPVLRRGVTEHRDLYLPLLETIKQAQAV